MKVDYREIVDVAESDQGTQLPSEARAVQFSSTSYAHDYADRVGSLGSILVKVVR